MSHSLSSQHGYRIVPTYTFGECRTYHNMQCLLPFRLLLNRLGLPGVIFWGRWWCPMLPLSTNLLTVYGKSLELPRVEEPSAELVDQWHGVRFQLLLIASIKQ